MKRLHDPLLVLLHLLHVTIILFCVVGWLLPPARPWHLLLCTLIFASWFVLGAWKGWGYCLVTDLQWKLLQRMGRPVPPAGYVPTLWHRLTGISIDARRIDQVTQGVFYFSALASLSVNWTWLQTWL